MNELKKNKKTIIICILLISVFLLISYNIKNKDKNDLNDNTMDNEIYLKKYGVNEYIPVYITNEDMAKNYLNDFKNKLINNPEDVYNILNEEYRQKKFSSLEEFISYSNELVSVSFMSSEVYSYDIRNIGGYKYFYIIDNTGEKYIFKEKSIMNYEVFLDAYTVRIE